jgi:hypothetical protein
MTLHAKAVAVMLAGVTGAAAAQGVVIARATPAAVVEVLKGELLPQGFQLVRADEKSALFALDRGMVMQQGSGFRGSPVHIVLEFAIRFKERKEGLQVNASEEVVGNPRSSAEFRKPVESRAERDNMQRLLDSVRESLEARRDSTRP